MLRAVLTRLVFAVAALAALATSAGISLAPHAEPPGTPPLHDHVLAAFRFGFLPEPATPPPALDPAMAALHRTLERVGVPPWALAEMPGMGAPQPAKTDGFTVRAGGFDPFQILALEFALLVVLVPRLPRPTRRLVAYPLAPALRCAQWAPALPPAPPRSSALRSILA